MSSGRVNRFQGKTAGWSVSSHRHSFLSVFRTPPAPPPPGDVNLGLVRPKLDWVHLHLRECVECAAFPPIAEYRKITNDLTKPLEEFKRKMEEKQKAAAVCILHCV